MSPEALRGYRRADYAHARIFQGSMGTSQAMKCTVKSGCNFLKARGYLVPFSLYPHMLAPWSGSQLNIQKEHILHRCQLLM